MIVENTEITAVWITNTKKKMGIRYAVMPELTPYSGLYLIDKDIEAIKLSELEHKVRSDHHYILADINANSANVSMHNQPRKATYIINSKKNTEEVYAEMKSDRRRKIKKAKTLYSVKEIDFSEFSDVLIKSFIQKNRPNPVPMELFAKLHDVCQEHNHVSILGAFDQNDELASVAYFTYDLHHTYYMAGGHLDNSNSMSLLIWEGIKSSLEQGKSFDFEGSMIPSIARFFKSFGSVESPYPSYTYSRGKWIDILVKFKQKMS